MPRSASLQRVEETGSGKHHEAGIDLNKFIFFYLLKKYIGIA